MRANRAPRLSVVVPVHQGAAVLPHSLDALLASDLPRSEWELIVVDDASTDRTAELAGERADHVVRLSGPPSGPAGARNQGGKAASGDFLVFVDADVCVHRETLGGFLAALESEPDVGAVFGAYDASPEAAGLVSQYRNLLHRHTHLEGAGEAETFWAGCGAVRRDVFLRAGGFDAERYARPQIEDIELGHRIRELGYRILLRPDLQGRHLKRWNLLGMVLTDVRDRGVPWTRLLLETGGSAARRSTLNLRTREKLLTGMTGAACVAPIVALATGEPIWAGLAAMLLIGVVVANLPLLRWFARERGVRFALAVVPLRLLYYFLNGVSAATGWTQHALGGARSSARAGAGRRPALAPDRTEPQLASNGPHEQRPPHPEHQ